MTMYSVITGDIVQSRTFSAPEFLSVLKAKLTDFGPESECWDVFRGDSFQLVLDCPEDSLHAAIAIKARLKATLAADVRMGIGIGEIDYRADIVAESNGEAFIRSGNVFETLGTRRVTLACATPWAEFDDVTNLLIKLALIPMDDWTPASAELVDIRLSQPDLGQVELAGRLGISQSSFSARKSRSHFDAISDLELWFRDQMQQNISSLARC